MEVIVLEKEIDKLIKSHMYFMKEVEELKKHLGKKIEETQETVEFLDDDLRESVKSISDLSSSFKITKIEQDKVLQTAVNNLKQKNDELKLSIIKVINESEKQNIIFRQTLKNDYIEEKKGLLNLEKKIESYDKNIENKIRHGLNLFSEISKENSRLLKNEYEDNKRYILKLEEKIDNYDKKIQSDITHGLQMFNEIENKNNQILKAELSGEIRALKNEIIEIQNTISIKSKEVEKENSEMKDALDLRNKILIGVGIIFVLQIIF